MAELPTRTDARLIVAAVTVLDHVEGTPPTEKEIAALVRWHEDRVRVVAHSLDEYGALSAIRSPFDVRYKVGDPVLVERLSDDEKAGAIKREIADFDARARESQQEIERMLGGLPGEERAEDPTAGLSDEFGDFKSKKPKDPFGNG